jgi:toxin HigB-1
MMVDSTSPACRSQLGGDREARFRTAKPPAIGPVLREGMTRQVSLDVCRQQHMFPPVIRSFRNRALKRYFEAGDPSGLSVPNVARVGRMLRVLDAANRPEHVKLPGYYWHPLQGKARWSIRVTGNWRITLRGTAPMTLPSTWRITIDDRAEDRNRGAGDASGRAPAGGDPAGTRPPTRRDRASSWRIAPGALRHLGRTAR